MNLQFLPEVVYMPERQALTLDLLAGRRRVRVMLGNAVLALLVGRAIVTEADQVAAFERCRPAVEALVRRLLAAGRGAEGGIIVTPEDLP